LVRNTQILTIAPQAIAANLVVSVPTLVYAANHKSL